MKSQSFSFTILLIISLISSVSCDSKVNSPSPFLRNFSLVETVRRMNLAEVGIVSPGPSERSSTAGPTSQRQENDALFTIVESKTENFDEERFLLKLHQQLTEEVSNSGLRITSAGGGAYTFHIEYSPEFKGKSVQFRGSVDVIGIRAEKDKYRVWCLVREFDFREMRPT